MDYSCWLGAQNILAEIYSSECIKTSREIQFVDGGEKCGVFPQVSLWQGEGMNVFVMEQMCFSQDKMGDFVCLILLEETNTWYRRALRKRYVLSYNPG